MGAGSHGRVVADCGLAAGWRELVHFDDSEGRSSGSSIVSGRLHDLMTRLGEFDGVVVGIGSNAVRNRLTMELAAGGARLTTLVHPHAVVSRHAKVGAGTVILAGAVVGIGVQLGRGVIINTGAAVDQDCVLDDGVHVAPGAHLARRVVVGRESWIGVGARVCEYANIGARVTAGAGALVTESASDGLTVVGVPARALASNPC